MSTEWCRSSCRAEGCWEEGPLPALSPSQRASLFPPAHPFPWAGGSYYSIERAWLRSPLLQLLLDGCSKNGNPVGRHGGGVWGEDRRTQQGGTP